MTKETVKTSSFNVKIMEEMKKIYFPLLFLKTALHVKTTTSIKLQLELFR